MRWNFCSLTGVKSLNFDLAEVQWRSDGDNEGAFRDRVTSMAHRNAHVTLRGRNDMKNKNLFIVLWVKECVSLGHFNSIELLKFHNF